MATPDAYHLSVIQESKSADRGGLILNESEYLEISKYRPELLKFIRPYIDSDEFINNKIRYCYWLKHFNASEFESISEIENRLDLVREVRLKVLFVSLGNTRTFKERL